MVTLRLRFAGLNLFTRAGSNCHVQVTRASAQINAHDRSVLHRHAPLLIVEKGTLQRRGTGGRPFLKPWPHGGRLAGRTLDFFRLRGNDQIRLRPDLETGLAPPSWLPRLTEVEARVDPNGLDSRAPLAATFILSGGVFKKGPDVKVLEWIGDHLGSDLPSPLAAWTELEYIVPDAGEVELHRGAGRPVLVLSPPAEGGPILAWVGNVATHGMDGEAVRPVEHFKWLYENTRMRPQPITKLAHPAVSEADFLEPRSPNSTFCPDGQYP